MGILKHDLVRSRHNTVELPWGSCQIHNIEGCAGAGNAGNVSLSPPPKVSDSVMHHGMCVTHVPWCMPGSPTSGFHWSRNFTYLVRGPWYIHAWDLGPIICSKWTWIYDNGTKICRDDFETSITKLDMNTMLGILAFQSMAVIKALFRPTLNKKLNIQEPPLHCA